MEEKNKGGRPRKAPTKVLSIRIREAEYSRLEKIASAMQMSFPAFLEKVLADQFEPKTGALISYINLNPDKISTPTALTDQAIREVYRPAQGSPHGNPWTLFNNSLEFPGLDESQRWSIFFEYAEASLAAKPIKAKITK